MENKKIKKLITDFLKSKNNLEKVDEVLINELLYQFNLLEDAKKDIELRGIQINVRKEGEPYYNLNQSVTIAQRCTKIIQSILKQLNVTPSDRLKIKDDETEKEFDLNEFLKKEND